MKKQRLILLACAFEYGFLAVLLCLNFRVVTGLAIAAACAAMHLILGGQTRLDAKLLKCVVWFVGATLMDFLLIILGITCHFEVIGGKVIGNSDAMFGVAEASMQLAAGLAVIRIVITTAIKVLGIEPKPEPLDSVAEVESHE